MAGHASQNIDKATLWGGKLSPYSTSYGKLMMWFFLVSDALTFGGLLTAFGFIRHSYSGEWPVGEKVFHHFPFMGETHMPLIYVAFMTFILIVSSVTMVLAVEAGHRNDRKGVTKWMIYTVIGGFIFLGSQVWEWSHFIHGSHFGKVQLEDGSYATVDHGEFGEVNKLVLLDNRKHTITRHFKGESQVVFGNEEYALEHSAEEHHDAGHGHGHGEDHSVMEGGHASHVYHGALRDGDVWPLYIEDSEKTKEYRSHANGTKLDSIRYHYDPVYYTLQTYEDGKVTEGVDTIGVLADEDGVLYAIYKEKNSEMKLLIMEDGINYKAGDEIEGAEAYALYEHAIGVGEPRRVIYGAHLKDNEYGPVQYGQFFFFITGFHGFHVFSGVMFNFLIYYNTFTGVYERRGHYEMVEKVGLYWHFVDLVWVFVFTFFYLV